VAGSILDHYDRWPEGERGIFRRFLDNLARNLRDPPPGRTAREAATAAGPPTVDDGGETTPSTFSPRENGRPDGFDGFDGMPPPSSGPGGGEREFIEI
jgi:hypothetical protein